MQQSERVAPHHRRLRFDGRPARAFEVERDHGVQCGIDGLDPLHARLEELNRRNRFAADQGAQLSRGPIDQLSHPHLVGMHYEFIIVERAP